LSERSAVRVGFIGTGGIASNHFGNLERIPEAQVVAVHDVQRPRAEHAGRRWGAQVFDDYHDLLAEVDAVYICVPPFAHGELELAAAAAGKHLFVEKPVALSLETARRVQEAVERAGVITSVGYHWRYLEGVDRAREILARRGNHIAMLLGWWLGGLPSVSWWRVQGQSGGQLVEQTTHLFDLARSFAGEVAEVFAVGNRRTLTDVEHMSVDDVGTVTLRFATGVIGQVANTCILPYHSAGLTILTRQGTLELTSASLKVTERNVTTEYRHTNNPYLVEDQVFIEAVRTGDPSRIRSTYADAVRTLAVTLACTESIAAGRPVAVPVWP